MNVYKIQNQQRTDKVGNQIKVTALRGKKVYIVKSAQLSKKGKGKTEIKINWESMYLNRSNQYIQIMLKPKSNSQHTS